MMVHTCSLSKGKKTSARNDRLKEFAKYEKLPPHNVVWDVPDEIPAMSKLLNSVLK
jgi:hypothetical protein